MKYLKILALMLASMLLFSCANGTETPSVDETEPPAETISVPLFTADTSYSIVNAVGCGTNVLSLIYSLEDNLKLKTSYPIETCNDDLGRNESADPEKREILIGNTNRPESKEVLEALAYNDYAVRVIGNKIVIAACNTDDLKKAIELFTDELLQYNADGSIYLTREYTHKGANDLANQVSVLESFRIIYPLEDTMHKSIAESIAEKINKLYGINVSTMNDAAEEKENEILIGATNRTASEGIDKLEWPEYKISIKNGKIAIGGALPVATELAFDKFVSMFLNSISFDGTKIPSEFELLDKTEIPKEKNEKTALSKGADLRIMSFNILLEYNDQKAKDTLPGRDFPVAKVILAYMPDVVGLQENSNLWYSLLNKQLDGIYKYASTKLPNGGENCTTILYNTQKAELLECDTILYTVGSSKRCRNVTWARFRRISDGEEYIVSSTHWDTTIEGREKQYPEAVQIINDIYNKYKLPIFAAGDYNSTEEELFAEFLALTSMVDPKYESKTKGTVGSTHHAISEPTDNWNLCIDHIAVTPGPKLIYYNTIKTQTALDGSDHCPIYIDVALK